MIVSFAKSWSDARLKGGYVSFTTFQGSSIRYIGCKTSSCIQPGLFIPTSPNLEDRRGYEGFKAAVFMCKSAYKRKKGM